MAPAVNMTVANVRRGNEGMATTSVGGGLWAPVAMGF
jgi:hypothetical protein